MKTYKIVHRPERNSFIVYEKRRFWSDVFLHSFYYSPLSASSMKEALKQAEEYISNLEEMDDSFN